MSHRPIGVLLRYYGLHLYCLWDSAGESTGNDRKQHTLSTKVSKAFDDRAPEKQQGQWFIDGWMLVATQHALI